jgi:isopenicillin N synthase-like dioxygenase
MHRVNTTLIPFGEDRVSLPFFLLPKMDGPLKPFRSLRPDGREQEEEEEDHDTTGYHESRDRGMNASVNRMGTFPQVTKRWWASEFKELGAYGVGDARWD